MEVFMHNLPLQIGEDEVKLFLASILHSYDFDYVQTNFAVHIHKLKFGARARTGTFTLADTTVGTKFLQLYASTFWVGRTIYFKQSARSPRPDIIESVSRSPWIDPIKEREQREKDQVLSSSSVSISSIQFGWQCRDGVCSIEAEATQRATLVFDPGRRELHVVGPADEVDDQDIIAVRYTSIHSLSRHFSTSSREYVLFLDMGMPPTFLRRNVQRPAINDTMNGPDSEAKYTRTWTYSHLDNPRAISYVGLVLRLVFSSKGESERFSDLLETAGIRRNIHSQEAIIERRGLFSAERLDSLEWNLRRFNFCVAFQLSSLLQNMVLDTSELLGLLPKVRDLVSRKGKDYAAKLLKEFQSIANSVWYSDDEDDDNRTILSCFKAVESDFEKNGSTLSLLPDDGSYYQSLHVTITPTSMFLNGPYIEQSNRVIRRYSSECHENFLRVTFRDESNLHYRFDREIDGEAFIKDRVGKFLKNGLTIAGRHFRFLAYSQSALKEHSVW
jgi:hypothetical protein